jgi:hypothetical protein
MSRWTCPRCEREFGKANQAHLCVPGNTVERTFAARPPVQREIYDAIVGHLRTLGPVHEDAVKVGVFLKHESKLAEVRPMARALSLELMLPRRIESPRMLRQVRVSSERIWHTVRLTAVAEVDAEVREWLSEAYFAAS